MKNNNFFVKIKKGVERIFGALPGLQKNIRIPSSEAQREVALTRSSVPKFLNNNNFGATSRVNTSMEFYVKIFWDRGFWKVSIFDLKHHVGKIKPLGVKSEKGKI